MYFLNKASKLISTSYNFIKNKAVPAIEKKWWEKLGGGLLGDTGKLLGNIVFSIFHTENKGSTTERNFFKCLIRIGAKNTYGKTPEAAAFSSLAFDVFNNQGNLNFQSALDKAKLSCLIAILQEGATPAIDTLSCCLESTLESYHPALVFLAKNTLEATARGLICVTAPYLDETIHNNALSILIASRTIQAF